MIKKCLFLCVLFVFKTECCVDDFFKCFSEFTESFFQINSKIEHVNASMDRLPEDYKQVKDVGVEGIADITSAIQKELFKRIKSDAADIVVTDNPKTKIYVKTFSYDFGFIPGFHGFDSDSDESEEEVKSIEFNTKTTNSDENGEFSTEFETLLSDDMSKSDLQNKTAERIIKNITLQNSSLEEVKTYESYESTVYESNIKSNQTTTLITQKRDKNIQNNNKPLILNKSKPETYVQESTTPITVKTTEGDKEKNSVIVKLSNNNQKITIKIPEVTTKNDIIEYTFQNTQENTPIKAKNNKTNESAKPDQSIVTEISIKEKQFEKDIRENLIEDDESDYGLDDSTDYPQIDYIDLYKDTTNEENLYVTTEKPKMDIKDEIVEDIEEYSLEIDTGLDNDNSTSICHGNTSDVSNIFPWIATIFIKNDSANQFQYICDGALSSEKLIITAARCFTIFNSSVSPDDMLVFLGKRSLQVMGGGERNVRVDKIILHSKFSEEGPNGQVVNDLALLVLEDEVTFSDDIRPACFGDGDGKSATTAWAPTGELKPVFFEKPSTSCDASEGTVCATYGNEVPLCPSYGGIVARRHTTHWYLHGIRTGDVADRGLCFSKDVLYTPLRDHLEWIMEYME